jgi:hypothetical protein
MPKTVWRPNPFEKPLNKFTHAEWQRERVVEYMRSVGKPVTMKQIAEALHIGGVGYYGKARRYAMVVANPTHEIHKPKHRPDIGWTLKEEYK